MEIQNELRLGNLVLMNGKVIEMDRKMFHAVLMGFPGYHPEPIPLTEEWLIKLGFKKPTVRSKFGKYELTTCLFILSRKYTRNGYQSEDRTEIKYVHQLQNIYLYGYGEELTLKN